MLAVSRKSKQDPDTNDVLSSGHVVIFDDIEGNEVFSGSLSDGRMILPESITKKAGVYRIIATDEQSGVSGESTFSVAGGKLARISLVPASQVLMQ